MTVFLLAMGSFLAKRGRCTCVFVRKVVHMNTKSGPKGMLASWKTGGTPESSRASQHDSPVQHANVRYSQRKERCSLASRSSAGPFVDFSSLTVAHGLPRTTYHFLDQPLPLFKLRRGLEPLASRDRTHFLRGQLTQINQCRDFCPQN